MSEPTPAAANVALTDYERTMLHADHSTPINRGWRSCPVCPTGVVERIVTAREIAAVRAAQVEISEMLDGFPAAGRHTRHG